MLKNIFFWARISCKAVIGHVEIHRILQESVNCNKYEKKFVYIISLAKIHLDEYCFVRIHVYLLQRISQESANFFLMKTNTHNFSGKIYLDEYLFVEINFYLMLRILHESVNSSLWK